MIDVTLIDGTSIQFSQMLLVLVLLLLLRQCLIQCPIQRPMRKKQNRRIIPISSRPIRAGACDRPTREAF